MKSDMKKYFLLLTLWLCTLAVVAQTDSLWILSGRVVDAKTRKPMAYVSVTSQSVGTVTNEDGEFTLKLRQEPSYVNFSCLGYQTRKCEAGSLKRLLNGRMESDLQMKPSSVMLGEIVVQGRDAKDLVLMAIDKITDNYPRRPNLLRGFYRETVQKRQRFVSISEGVVDVYKSGYQKSAYRDGVAILKGRRLLSLRSNDTLGVKLQGGPVLPVFLDVVKDRTILFNDEELGYYSFKYASPEKLGDRMQYVVEMHPQIFQSYALFNGKLYIDQETLAFTRIDLSLDMSDPKKAAEMLLRSRPLGLRFAPREMTVSIDFKTDGGLTRLNYIRNVIRFRCDWKRKLFKSNFTIVSEMVTTDWQEGEDIKPIRLRDTFYRKDNFYDKVIYFNDPDFWGSDNIIEPTEDLLKGIEKIKRRLK